MVKLALTSPKAIAAAVVGLVAHRLQRTMYFQKTRGDYETDLDKTPKLYADERYGI